MGRDVTVSTPVYAEIVATDIGCTIVQLSLFGKYQRVRYDGNAHHERAVAWVNDWNRHLAKEWMVVRGMPAAYMAEFTKTLAEQGISNSEIDRAMARMKIHVTE